MLGKPFINAGNLKQVMNPGDMIDLSEQPIFGYPLTGNQALLASELVRSEFIALTGGVAFTLTLPSADAIIKSIIGSLNKLSPPDNALYGSLPGQSVQTQWPANVQPLQPGSSFRRTFRNENSGITTFAAPATAGIQTLGTLTVAAALWAEFLFRVLSSAPSITIPVTTTNTTLTLTNVPADFIANVTPGMSVYGVGIGAAAVVTAVNLDTRVITVSVASTATADNVGVLFTPTVTVQRLRSGTNV